MPSQKKWPKFKYSKEERKILDESDPKDLKDLKTVPKERWDEVKRDMKNAVKGKLPEGNLVIVQRAGATKISNKEWKRIVKEITNISEKNGRDSVVIGK